MYRMTYRATGSRGLSRIAYAELPIDFPHGILPLHNQHCWDTAFLWFPAFGIPVFARALIVTVNHSAMQHPRWREQFDHLLTSCRCEHDFPRYS